MLPKPFRDVILVLDEFRDGPVGEYVLQDFWGVAVLVRWRGGRCGAFWSINPLASGQAVP